MYATKQIEPMDDEIAEEWTRDIADPRARSVHGVGAHKATGETEWPWRVSVWAMEHIREEPLESILRREIIAAMRGVAGVLQAEEEDREVWIVRGEPTGRALVEAIAVVIDAHAAEIRRGIDG